MSSDLQHNPHTLALDLHGVSVAYTTIGKPFAPATAAIYALENITFQVPQGEHLAVIGPNGAGKSTLLKVIAGVLKPDKGQVALFGDAPNAHICIAYVPQRRVIDWSFPVTVQDVVMMGRTKQIGLFHRPGKRDHQIVQESLARVQASHLAHKQIGQLSGGQQQRVFIARALALETNLLLMDEPLSGLDRQSKTAILDILASLRPDGVTVLVATHDLTLAGQQFDRILLLNKHTITLGAPPDVLTNPNLLAAYGGH